LKLYQQKALELNQKPGVILFKDDEELLAQIGSLGVLVISKSERRKGVSYRPLPIRPRAAVGAQRGQ
jgi:hypothetical protein